MLWTKDWNGGQRIGDVVIRNPLMGWGEVVGIDTMALAYRVRYGFPLCGLRGAYVR